MMMPAIEYSHTIGMLSNLGRGFQNPVDAAIDSQGVLYVLNRAGPEIPVRLPYKRVSRCTLAQEYLGEFGSGGTAPGQFWWPSGLAGDADDRLYVTDEALNRVTIFGADGGLLGYWGEAGRAPGQLHRPSSVAVDGGGNLLIADSGNHRVQRFTSDGRLLQVIGNPGSNPPGRGDGSPGNYPGGNSGNNPGGNPGVGQAGNGPGEFNLPWGVAVDADDRIYVADWGNHRVQVLDADGNYLRHFPTPTATAAATGPGGNADGRAAADTGPGGNADGRAAADAGPGGDADGRAAAATGPGGNADGGETAGCLKHPAGVAVGADGGVFVADWGNERVRVFNAAGELTATLRGDSIDPLWADDYFAANPDEGALRKASDLEPSGAGWNAREESANVERRFWGPTAVRLDGQGHIIVVDSCRHRLQVYRLVGG